LLIRELGISFLPGVLHMRFGVFLISIAFIAANSAARDGAEGANRLPVPDAAAQATAEKTIRQIFKDGYAKTKPADQAELGAALFDLAEKTKDDPTARYALLRQAIDMAARGGDIPLATKAIDELVGQYAVASAPTKLQALVLLDKGTRTVEIHKAIFDLGWAASTEAIDADDYDSAASIVKVAGGVAIKSKSAANASKAANRARDIERLRAEHRRIKSDIDALAKNPDDADAAERVGRFACFFKGNWNAGLPLLAKSKDEKLRSIAAKDLAVDGPNGPTDAVARIELGDAWWIFSATLDRASQAEVQVHAADAYRKVAAELTGLAKVRVDKRIADADKLTTIRTAENTAAAAKAIESSWTVIFRSNDPRIWGNDVNAGPNHRSVSLLRVPDTMKYLRLRECAKNQYVVISLTRDRLDKDSSDGLIGWNGTAKMDWKGCHLGIFDRTTDEQKAGDVSISVPGFFKGYKGWGFGHRIRLNDIQAYAWAGISVPPTVFEIAVKTDKLSAEESKHLLGNESRK
jgi:hypothetical protein